MQFPNRVKSNYAKTYSPLLLSLCSRPFRKRNSTQTAVIVDAKRCQAVRVLKRLDFRVQEKVAGEKMTKKKLFFFSG